MSSLMPESVDVMQTEERYREFYDRLGRDYPESEMIHGTDPFKKNFLLDRLAPFAEQGVSMLDIGCNDGVYSIPYGQMGGTAHGIDISAALVEKARRRASGLPVTFEVADIEEFHSEEKYGLVLMSEVIEHVRRPDRAIAKAVAALRPRGELLLSTPSAYCHVSTLRYVVELLKRKELTAEDVIYTDSDTCVLGKDWGIHGFKYRHDGYYLYAMCDWLSSFGLRRIKSFTLGMAPYRRPFRTVLRSLESKLRTSTVPGINLFGLTCVVLMEKKA